MDNFCCICMNDSTSLVQINKLDTNNLSFLNKLTICIPDLEWLPQYVICETCLNELNLVYKFRNKCLQTFDKRKVINIQSETDTKINFDQTSICQLCKKFVKENDLSFHLQSEHQSFSCESCFHIFVTQTELQEHIQNVHEINNIEEEKLNDTYVTSEDINNYSSDSEEKFIVKLKPQSGRAKRLHSFPCENCSNVFNSSTKLVKHSVSEHNMNKKDVKPFVCTKCNSKFSSSSNYSQHLKYHATNRIFICTYCGKSYKTKTDLQVHEKSHLNKREYQCRDCPKCFNTHKNLRSHRIVVHTDPLLWTFVCDVCDKRFPMKSNYDQHMRRHNNEKRFACHLCEKRFVDNCVLKKHVRSHSNVRAFKCNTCLKEYKDKRIMQLHMAKIHNIGTINVPVRVKKHFCHMCPKSYFAKNKLTRHLYSHTGEKPFVCNICEKKFTDKSYVKLHMKNFHNILDSDIKVSI